MQGLALYGKLVFWLLAVGLLAYGTSRFLARRVQGLGRSRRLEVLESIAVGPRRHICLVRVDEQVLCVGVTDGQIATLCQVPIAIDPTGEPPA